MKILNIKKKVYCVGYFKNAALCPPWERHVEKAKRKDVALTKIKMGNVVAVANCCPFYVSFYRLSVSRERIVATFLSNVVCRQNPLEGLLYRISSLYFEIFNFVGSRLKDQFTAKVKVKNDQRSKFSNLSNWKEEA